MINLSNILQDNKILIHCNDCNTNFLQSVRSHISNKSGCSKCYLEKKRSFSSTFKYEVWDKKGNNSKNFESFKVYIIRCWNENEEFFKIGKTYRKINQRFRKKDIPYSYEILKTFEGDSRKMSELEHQLQKDNKEFKYLPKVSFGGEYECFTQIKESSLNNYESNS